MVKISLNSKLEIQGLSEDWINWIKAISTFDLQDLGPVPLYEETGDCIKVPRGLQHSIMSTLRSRGVVPEIIDETYEGLPLGLKINNKINYTEGDFYYQGSAADALLKHSTARLEAPTGSGKTIMSCIAMHKYGKGPTLFLTMKENLVSAFVQEACEVFDLPESEIGLIKGKKMVIKPITVGSLPTLGGKNFLENKMHELKDKFSVVIFDECHRSKAITYRDALMCLNPKLLYGVSATPDEILDKEVLRMMEALLGPIVLRITEDQIPNRITPEAYIRRTGRYFTFNSGTTANENHWERSVFQKAVAKDEPRNQMIIQDVVNILNQDPSNKVLICVCLVDHGKVLGKMLEDIGIKVCFPYKKVKDYPAMKKFKEFLRDKSGAIQYNEKGKPIPLKDDKGKVVYSKTKYKLELDDGLVTEAVQLINDGQARVLIGSYNAFTEGFNCKPLNTVCFVGPVSGRNNTRTYQLIGRCCRKSKGKEKVFALYYSDNSNPANKLEKWTAGFEEYCNDKWGNCYVLDPPTNNYS